MRLAAPDEIFADYPVRGQTRIKVMTAPPAPPAGVTYRPMTAAEYPAWLAAGEQRYLADMVRAGSHTPEQARKKAEEDSARCSAGRGHLRQHPFGASGRRRADRQRLAQARHLPEVTYGYSLVVDPEFRGRGHGRSAMAIGEQVTWDVGDQVVMFNVFGGNEAAMSLYTAVSYRVVEETRSRDLAAGVDGWFRDRIRGGGLARARRRSGSCPAWWSSSHGPGVGRVTSQAASIIRKISSTAACGSAASRASA